MKQASWEPLALKDAGVILLDCVHDTPPPAEGGYPYIAIPQVKQGRLDLAEARLITREHLLEWTRKAKPQTHDVIVSRRCNPGETAFVPDGFEGALGQNLVLLRSNGAKIHPPFLRWLLRGPAWWTEVRKFINVGAVFDSLRCGDIPNFTLPVPPPPTQQAITQILGALDDKIDLNRRMNDTLHQMGQALFRSWFVDFDPVHAKAAGRKVFGVEATTASQFPNAFEPSPIGKIPKGWSAKNLETFLERLTDGAHESPPSNNKGLPMASVKDLKPWGIDMSACRLIPKDDFDRLVANDCKPLVGDVLLAKDGARCLETVCEYRQGDDVVLLSSVAILRPRIPELAGFLALWLSLNETRAYLRDGFLSGSAIPRVVLKDLKRALLVAPPDSLVAAFDSVTIGWRSQIQSNVAQSQSLADLRDALLPKLLSGELRIKDAEKLVGEAT